MAISNGTMKVLKDQACHILERETLDEQFSDRLDFFEIGVLQIQELLEMAYEQGQLDSI